MWTIYTSVQRRIVFIITALQVVCSILKFDKVKDQKGKVQNNLHNVTVLLCIKGRTSNHVSTAPSHFQVTASSSNKKFDLSTKALRVKCSSEAGHATNRLIPLTRRVNITESHIRKHYFYKSRGCAEW